MCLLYLWYYFSMTREAEKFDQKGPPLFLKIPHIKYPSDLPIVEKRETIIAAIRRNPVVVITGETGSGKSTQIPKMCLEAGLRGKIGCTQPRRVAAVSLALRVAEELGEAVEGLVGYQIRFQDKTSPKNRIKFMTDGILLAETRNDRLLRKYGALIIDEAHERSLNIDFLLGILRQLLNKRKDLKIIITSATIDTEKFSQNFNNAPIIEVSGRTYPVDVWYRPLNHELEEKGEITYIDQAVKAVEELKRKGQRGDVLIFMPSERDIRETVQRLEGRKLFNAAILPLFGRLSASEQHRIFQKIKEQKIIVATNIAETSITVPGIKYVLDTGVARISQYNPRTHTQSLPVQTVSKSSADQRKGRCGRVESGICIRLYSEEEYISRPQYTLPEIRRSNLAKVILQMVFLHLGEVASFPFIDPPAASAIKEGYAELRELGALDRENQLTPTGGLMARLPLDPRISRMLIEAKKERALREIMVIAAALSIMDPRERPSEQEGKADQMHAQFRVPNSDFLTLLKIWDTYHDTLERFRTQNQMRKFCRTHFLSYPRMREWQDIHEQISSILKEMGDYPINRQPASYEAIHRSILSGLLSHIAEKNLKEKHLYRAARGREVMIFPGSGQFGKAGQWIVAAEIVRTSKLFARCVATIQPEWLENLAGGLCKSSFFDPHWEKNRGQVVVYERVTLFGLIIVPKRKVNFGPIRPQEARKIFLRQALVEDEVKERLLFLEYNQKLISQIEEWEDKTRRRDILVDEETLYQFYDERITQPISDMRTFQKWIKERGGDEFLNMKPEDLVREAPAKETCRQFPDFLTIKGVSFPLSYKFEPGHEEDGVTIHIPATFLSQVEEELMEWLVPGLLLEKITALIKGLPKTYRKQLIPLQQTAQRLFQELIPYQGSLCDALGSCIRKYYGLSIPLSIWKGLTLPDHLVMRITIKDPKGKGIGQGRDVPTLRNLVPKKIEDGQWKAACAKWERDTISAWDFDDLPEKIILQDEGMPRFAYPGLVAQKEFLLENDSVSLRLFTTFQEAKKKTQRGLLLLYALQYKKEINKLKKDWDLPPSLRNLYQSFGDRRKFNEILFCRILQGIFPVHEGLIPQKAQFLHHLENVRGKLAKTGWQIVEEIQELLKDRQATLDGILRFSHLAKNTPSLLHLFKELKNEVSKLLPPDFLLHYDTDRLRQIPRYLKAIRIRIERAYTSPQKDKTKAQPLAIHQTRLKEACNNHEPSPQKAAEIEEYRWMLEEYKISLFAPEVGTAYRISSKKLEQKWQEILNL